MATIERAETKEPPIFCPFCSSTRIVVRHVMGNMFEIMCQSDECERSAVVMADDHVKL